MAMKSELLQFLVQERARAVLASWRERGMESERLSKV